MRLSIRIRIDPPNVIPDQKFEYLVAKKKKMIN
jgi:hypothetical protein